MRIDCFDRWMVARFPQPQRCLSWAIVNGGEVLSDAVAWRFLAKDEATQMGGDPQSWLRSCLEEAGLGSAVGLVTSRRLHSHVESSYGHCRCLATVGLSNALAAGDQPYLPAKATAQIDTINLLCWIQAPLTIEASLEALALASEARAAAMLEARIPSRMSGRSSTGTGTDCFVIAHPREGQRLSYCGKHTPLGHQIATAVMEVVERGATQWLAEQNA